MSKLFENPGEKIKKVAMVLFVLNVIAGIILAFTLGIDQEYYYDYHDSKINGLFWAFFFGVPLASYIECLVLYAFGDLVENSENIADYSELLYKNRNAQRCSSENSGNSVDQLKDQAAAYGASAKDEKERLANLIG